MHKRGALMPAVGLGTWQTSDVGPQRESVTAQGIRRRAPARRSAALAPLARLHLVFSPVEIRLSLRRPSAHATLSIVAAAYPDAIPGLCGRRPRPYAS
jgi:hypothetical protein